MRRLSYIAGMGRIRFTLACWVVLSHVPFPWGLERTNPFTSALRLLANNAFCGVAAVIAFFLISGLCIHFPYRHDLEIDFGKNILRRSLRIGAPLAVIVLLGKELDVLAAPLWTIWCEEIYYFLYPWLLAGRKHCGSWRPHLVIALIGAAALMLWHPEYKNYWENGPLLTWLLGLPCWLLGCMLAEGADALAAAPGPPSLSRKIWVWRAGAAGIGAMLSVLRFHAGVGFPLSLTCFAFYVFAWLKREIQLHNGANAPGARWPGRSLDAAGRWSYSLYLVHEMVSLAFGKIAPPWAAAHPLASWPLRILCIYATAYLFYLLVERPSHRLSRKIHGPREDPARFYPQAAP